MTNFKELNEEEHKMVWDKFYDLFHFKPGINRFLPAISTRQPKLTFSIKNCFRGGYPLDTLEEFALRLFTEISRPGDRLYALNWQHASYDFDPREQMDRNEFGEWIVPALPDGDYYIFLTKDFNNVWFGHPWKMTITLIGGEIVKEGKKIKADFPK